MQVQVFFVERPKGDPLIGRSLWSDVDQVNTFNPAAVASLRQNGMRFGVVGTSPPHALQAALGMTEESSLSDDSRFRMVGQRFTRRSGEEFEVEAWSGYPTCTIDHVRPDGIEQQTYDDVRCLFRVKLQRLQDGWAKLELTPEIHHGEMKLRKVAGDFSYMQRPSQLVAPCFNERFDVELNLGEMVVVGADGNQPKSLGHHFFLGGESESRTERLLVIRLADMQRIDAVY